MKIRGPCQGPDDYLSFVFRYDMGRKNRMFRLMNARYNVNGLFWCSEYEVISENELKCLTTKHKIGYC